MQIFRKQQGTLLKGVPKGNWYIGVHGYKYLDGSNKKVLSKWAEVQKVTVKTSLVTGKPAVKSAKVSRQGTKRKVTVKLLYQKPVTERTGYWQRKYLNPKMEVIHMSAVMLILRKIRRKLQSFLKNVKPGVYYLTGRAYVKGYAKKLYEMVRGKEK